MYHHVVSLFISGLIEILMIFNYIKEYLNDENSQNELILLIIGPGIKIAYMV